MKSLIAIFILFFIVNTTYAQLKQDGAWKKNILEREPIAYQAVREADVFWSKRLWRIIDIREKQNLIFTYPKMLLAEILHTAALNGEITAYDNTVLNGDQFKMELPPEKIGIIGKSIDSMWGLNPITQEPELIISEEKLDYSKIKRFKIKEDWFFNIATSTMEVRIIGIAPLLETYDENGNYLGDETLYWLYYPDLRPVLAKVEAYNAGNNAVRLSWDDIFEARIFASYIYKEDNVYDRNISEYATAMDALFESERIKEKIFNFEHDLWSY